MKRFDRVMDIIALALLALLAGLGFALFYAILGLETQTDSPFSPSKSTPSKSTLPISELDQKPMTPSSLHCAHIQRMSELGTITLDGGRVVSTFWTGGSDPFTSFGPGVICASVPSFADRDEDGTYYFRSFTPDAGGR